MKKSSGKSKVNQKRTHQRFSINRIVKYSVANNPELEITSDIVNISQGGLQIISRTPMKPDTLLKMKLEIPGKDYALNLDAKVVWSSASEDEKGVYYSGISFPALKEDLRSIIL